MGDATARPLCSGAGYPLALSCFCHLRTELELANLRSHGPTKNQQDVHREEDAGSPAQRSRADFRRMTETPITVSHCVAQRFLVNVVPCSAPAPAPGCILVQTALTRGRKPSGIASGDRKWRHRTPRTWRASYLCTWDTAQCSLQGCKNVYRYSFRYSPKLQDKINGRAT